jgi:hypothetical protein
MSTKESGRLKALAAMVHKKEEAPKAPEPIPEPVAVVELEEMVANAPHGLKSDHVKVTVTLPPKVYEIIMEEVTRRKVAKGKYGPPQLSAVIREAVVMFIGNKP